MRSVTKYDCAKRAEISLILNDHDQIVGMEIYFEEPVDIVDFRLEQVFQVRPVQMIRPPMPSTPEPPTPRRVAPPEVTTPKKPCPGCR